jgi:hypothetical protein
MKEGLQEARKERNNKELLYGRTEEADKELWQTGSLTVVSYE